MSYVRGFLVFAGLLACSIGGCLLIAPVAFEAGSGLQLPRDPHLLSEVRAPGGFLFVVGGFIFAGGLRRRLARPALVASAAVYLAYGFSRLLGLALDGPPGPAPLTAGAFELALGFVSLALQRIPGDQRVRGLHDGLGVR